MYFKCVKDGKIIDVFSEDDIVYTHYNAALRMMFRAYPGEEIDGVIASDQSAVYVFKDIEGFETVQLVEFDDEAEYRSIKEEIDAGRIPIDPADPDEPEGDKPDDELISASEALLIIFGGE